MLPSKPLDPLGYGGGFEKVLEVDDDWPALSVQDPAYGRRVTKSDARMLERDGGPCKVGETVDRVLGHWWSVWGRPGFPDSGVLDDMQDALSVALKRTGPQPRECQLTNLRAKIDRDFDQALEKFRNSRGDWE